MKTKPDENIDCASRRNPPEEKWLEDKSYRGLGISKID